MESVPTKPFLKPKWHLNKEAIIISLHGIFFERSQTQNLMHAVFFYFIITISMFNYVQFYTSSAPLGALSGFSDTSGHHLLIDAQSKPRQSPEAHRHGAKLGPDADVVPREELGGGAALAAGGAATVKRVQNRC